MSKLAMVVLFLTNAVFHVQAQEAKFSLALDIGTSLPVGAFSKAKSEKSKTAHAIPGWCTSASVSYRLISGIDLIGVFHLQQNSTDNKFYEDYFIDNPLIFLDGSTRYYANWKVKKHFWSVKSGLLGVSRKLTKESSDNKLSVKVKILAGISFVTHPKFSATSKTDTSFILLDRSSASSSGLTFLGGFDLFYKIDKQLSMKFSSDYLWTSKMLFTPLDLSLSATDGGLVVPNLYQISNSVKPPVFNRIGYETRQLISSINIRLGMSLAF
jgi:hypothetical protein